jgi:hypothetical protein
MSCTPAIPIIGAQIKRYSAAAVAGALHGTSTTSALQRLPRS